MSFGIPGKQHGKLYTVFQLEEMKKLEQKLEMIKIQVVKIDAAIKDYEAIAAFKYINFDGIISIIKIY